MKTISISVEDDLYAVAMAEAAKRRKTLSDLLHDLIAGLHRHRESVDDAKQRTELDKFFAIVDAKPKLPGSVGPLNREELYQRGLPGY